MVTGMGKGHDTHGRLAGFVSLFPGRRRPRSDVREELAHGSFWRLDKEGTEESANNGRYGPQAKECV